jgi:tetratricopeptide (TPR) repeat protein
MSFLKEPKDWIESFGRRFMITEHKHLEGGKEREMLPFLKLSAELDPQRIDTYTVAAYWLSRTLGKPDQAEEFLREGLKANPRSYEILFEMGRIAYENRKDAVRARNLWSAALGRWNEQEPQKKEPNLFVLDQILVNLARLEEKQGNYAQAIHWLEVAIAKGASPNPDVLKKQIEEFKAKVPPK